MSKEKTESKPKNRKIDPLKSLLARHPGLAEKLLKALETDRFFITITAQFKNKPTDKHDLHHYYNRRNFMTADVVPSLKQLASDLCAKENPTAEIESQEWH